MPFGAEVWEPLALAVHSSYQQHMKDHEAPISRLSKDVSAQEAACSLAHLNFPEDRRLSALLP